MNKKTLRIIFVLYLLAFTLVVLLKFDGTFYKIKEMYGMIHANRELGIYNINYKLFKTISVQLNHLPAIWALSNLMINIVVMIPWGILTPQIFDKMKRWGTFLMVTIVYVCAIECIQLVFCIGFFDVDDIILNVLGALLGYVITSLVSKMKYADKKTTVV